MIRSAVLHVRCTPSLRARVRRAAKADGRSASELAARLLEQALDALEQQSPKEPE